MSGFVKKITKTKHAMFPSELRFDLASRDWVIIATGRARRPETFKKEKHKQDAVSPRDCPFCDISTQERPTLVFNKGKEVKIKVGEKAPKNWTPLEDSRIIFKNKSHLLKNAVTSNRHNNPLTGWTTIIIPNKYPAFSPYPELNKRIEGGLYEAMNAVGFHEVVVTRDHKKHLAQFSPAQVKEVIDVYQSRYLDLMEEKFVNHISIFHNHGEEAGASISHPHSQIITTPLIDTDLKNALLNSRRYFKAHKKCIYCLMGEWEKKNKKRVVFENNGFLAICPFASKSAFEVIISPKKHLPYFERITEKEKKELAEAFRIVLNKIYKGLNNPAYNFYLHTAPCDNKKYDSYHWHWTILPKTSIWAGFEIGTEMEISTIEPEKAAEYLRKQ